MTDPSRRDGWGNEHPGADNYPAHPDAAYGQQSPYHPDYQAPEGPRPTEPLPAYSPYAGNPYPGGHYGPTHPIGTVPPEPPKGGASKPPRWLWALAGAALVIVLGLVMGLVIVTSSKQDTVVAPPQTPIEPTTTAPTTTRTTTRTPTTTRTTSPVPTTTVPSPSGPLAPPDQTDQAGLHTVVYSVEGEGRAISILYLGSGRVLQTEFNVLLPWSKEVQLTGPANVTASVSIVNVGHRITCSVTVDGTETQQKSGTGLTLCSALGTR